MRETRTGNQPAKRIPVRALLWGFLTLLIISVMVLECMGFRFTAEGVAPGFAEESNAIHADGCDFYYTVLPLVDENDRPVTEIIRGALAVKHYGPLKKAVNQPELRYSVCNAGGERVAVLEGYTKGDTIHWFFYPVHFVGENTLMWAKELLGWYNETEINADGTVCGLFKGCYFTTTGRVHRLEICGAEFTVEPESDID